jgi:hypothetical protein
VQPDVRRRSVIISSRPCHVFFVDKVEGFTIDAAGNAFAVTDNDGVDDSNGETVFMRLGAMEGMQVD